MPAPDFDTLFDIETAVESACVSKLADLGIANADSAPRGPEDIGTPRVEVQLVLGAATGHMANPYGAQSTRAMIYSEWFFRLTFSVITNQGKNNASHSPFRGKVRGACARFLATLDSRLQHHTLTNLVPAATVINLVAKEDEDVSQLHFDGRVSIRNDAWPAATS